LKNNAFVTLTFRTSPDDWRTNNFELVVCAAADEPTPASAMISLQPSVAPHPKRGDSTTNGGGQAGPWSAAE
jgi:hypothetical protein